MGVIYKITSPSGKIYVGQTINYSNRVKVYKSVNCVKQRKLYNSFLKYGFDSHLFDILEENIQAELLNEREIYWIENCKSYYKVNKNGLNLNKGGNTPVWNNARIASFSELFKGNKNPFYGKTHTPEMRKKYSENAKIQMQTQKPTRLAIEKGANAKMKPIVTYDVNGDFVSEFPSLSAIAKTFGVDVTTIRDVLKSNGWVKKKYTCRYKQNDYPLKIAV